MDRKSKENYWFETGSPSFLIQLLKDNPHDLKKLINSADNIEASYAMLDSFDINNIPALTVLYQAGYLTIKNYSNKEPEYLLGYPNKEIKESMTFILISLLTHQEEYQTQQTIIYMKQALRENNIDKFCATLQELFADIPFKLHIEQEKYYHSIFQLMGDDMGP